MVAVARIADKPVVNPFLDEYTRQEIEFFGLTKFKKTYGDTTVEVRTMTMPSGRVDDFLNKNFRTCSMQYPHLFVNGTMWMSLSYMEAQSHFVPIQVAHGRVGVLGLGLGYYVLRIMGAHDVEEIDVYEIEPGVVEYFKECFSDRPGFDKINFIVGDARELMVDKEYDYVYSDIYLQMLGDNFVEDIVRFTTANSIGMYHPWCIEQVFLEAINAGHRPGRLPMPVRALFKFFVTTKIDVGRGVTFCPGEHSKAPLKESFVNEVIEILDWPNWDLQF